LKTTRKNSVITKATTIKTNLLEILQALTSQTKDDASIVESLSNIFTAYRGRFGQTLAPVRIVDGAAKRTSRRRDRTSRGTALA
jgi:hypothetical protein